MTQWGFQAAGWSEFDQPDDVLWYEGEKVDAADDPNPFATIPSNVDPRDVEGIWVHAFDWDDPDDETFFWVRTYTPLQDWDEWLYVVGVAMDQHNMGLA